MISRSLRYVSSSVALVAVLAGCGGDSASDGDLDAFCEEVRLAEEGEPVSIDEDFTAGIAEIERIRDLAPGEIRDDIDVILDAFRELEDLEAGGADEDEAFAAAFEVMLSPEVTQASEALETFQAEECGIETSTGDAPTDDGGELSDDAPMEDGNEDAAEDDSAVGDGAGEADGQIVTEAAPGVPDPLFDPFFDDDEVDLGVVSINGAQYHLDVNYTDAPWRTRLGSFSNFGSTPPELGVGGLDLTDAEASEVCAALVEYLMPFDPESTIVVSTYGQNDDGMFGEEEPLLSTTAAQGC